jgi:cysteine desulfurase/selenocysteine lyase
VGWIVGDLWSEIRQDFTGLRGRVYLDSAAAAPVPRPVCEALERYTRELEEGDIHWDRWISRRESAREAVARFIGATPEEIALVPNTSVGMNAIVDLLGGEGPVLTDELEFPTVTLPWIHRGVAVHFVPAVEGVVRTESFGVSDAPRAATIVVSHVQFSNGCRLDLEAFSRLKAGRHLVVSASQSAGAFPIDVKRFGIDALACSGHKWLCAGYGAGFVYVSRELLQRFPPREIGWMSVEDPYRFDNRAYRVLGTARRMELGCPSLGPMLALGAAVEYLQGIGIEIIAERVLALNLYLTYLLGRAGFEVLSPGGPHRSGETLVGVDQPDETQVHLREKGVFVTRKPEGLRIATHFFNDESDIEACVATLAKWRESRGQELDLGGM